MPFIYADVRVIIVIVIDCCETSYVTNNTRFFIPCCSFADGSYMILGGQHIAAACLVVRNKILKEQNLSSDESLPAPYRFVTGIVLRLNTPPHQLTSAAG